MTLEERYYNYCKYIIKNSTLEMVEINGIKIDKSLTASEKYIKSANVLMNDINAFYDSHRQDCLDMIERVHNKIDEEMKR